MGPRCAGCTASAAIWRWVRCGAWAGLRAHDEAASRRHRRGDRLRGGAPARPLADRDVPLPPPRDAGRGAGARPDPGVRFAARASPRAQAPRAGRGFHDDPRGHLGAGKVVSKIFVGVGSNLGDREFLIRKAVESMRDLPRTLVVRVSSLYDTDPVGEVDQPAFLNAVVWLETTLEPRELLWQLLLIE